MKNIKADIIKATEGGEIAIYSAGREGVRLEVKLAGETLWLNQKQLADLFKTERSVITKHLGNIFHGGELAKSSVCAFFAHTAADGKTYKTAFYNLDVIISVGYRVNSKRATQFRIWATQVLKNHSFINGITALPPLFFYGSLRRTGCFTETTAQNGCRITPWWRLR